MTSNLICTEILCLFAGLAPPPASKIDPIFIDNRVKKFYASRGAGRCRSLHMIHVCACCRYVFTCVLYARVLCACVVCACVRVFACECGRACCEGVVCMCISVACLLTILSLCEGNFGMLVRVYMVNFNF